VWETFGVGSDAQNLARADGFKRMVEAAGQRWPDGWVKGEGFVRPPDVADPMMPPPSFDKIGEEYVRQIVDLSPGQRKRYLGQLQVLARTPVSGRMVWLTNADRMPMLVRTLVAVKTMLAIVHDRYGTVPEEVLRLEGVDKPTIAADQVLVRVRPASVDRGTWHVMAGLPYPIRVAGFGLRRPKYLNPGRSLAGTVEAVGNDVTGSSRGMKCSGSVPVRSRSTQLSDPTSSQSSRRIFLLRRRLPFRSPGLPPCRPCATTERSRLLKRC